MCAWTFCWLFVIPAVAEPLRLDQAAAVKLAMRRRKAQSAFWYMQGFLNSWVRRESFYLDKAERRFLRRLQYQRLLSERKVIEQYARTEK